VVKLAQFSTGGVAHYCIGGNTDLMNKSEEELMALFYKAKLQAETAMPHSVDYDFALQAIESITRVLVFKMKMMRIENKPRFTP